jgi:hypothetical protein
MTRRDFSLGGLKGLAAGAMAWMGCAGKVAANEPACLEPGTKVRITEQYGWTFTSEIECVCILRGRKNECIAYQCETPRPAGYPNYLPHVNWYSIEQIEAISS